MKVNRVTIPFEVKATKGRQIEGHGSVFGNVDLGGDVVMPGAFSASIAKHKSEGTMPKMLWAHDTFQLPPGAWTHIEEDDKGLFMRGSLADTQMGNDIRTLIQMKALDGLSIGFIPVDMDWNKEGHRLIKQADLWETSIVVFPMNPRAVIEATKSMYPDPRSLESHFRENGCTKKEARDLVNELFEGGVRPPDRCEADPEDGSDSRCEAEGETAEAIKEAEAVMARIMAETVRRITKLA